MRKTLLILLFIPLLIGCSSFQKQHFKSEKFYKENKDLLADLCASEYPSETKYIKGETTIKIDTVFSKEVIEVDCPDGTKQECPPPRVINKIITSTDTILKPNTALESKLRNDINELSATNILLSKENEKALKELKSNKWTIRGLFALIAILIILIFKR